MDAFLVNLESVVLLARSKVLIRAEGTAVLPGLLGLCFRHGYSLSGGENSKKKKKGAASQLNHI